MDIECICGASLEVEEEAAPWACPECGETVAPLEAGSPPEDAADEVDPWQTNQEQFYAELAAAFMFPLRGMGAFILFGGTVLAHGMVFLCAALPVALVLAPFVASYFLQYLRSVVEGAAAGHERLPDWPGAEEYEPLRPLFEFVVVLGASFAPLIATSVVGHVLAPNITFQTTYQILQVAALGASAFVFPMAYLSAILWHPAVAFGYSHLARSFLRAPVPYLVCASVSLAVFFWGGVLCLAPGVVDGLFHRRGWGLFAIAPVCFLNLYLALALARLLGAYYRTCRFELDWFERK